MYLIKYLLLIFIFVFGSVANAKCFSKNDLTSECRYKTGDSWCKNNSLNRPYAYNCEPFLIKHPILEKTNDNLKNTLIALKKGADNEKIFNTALDYFEGTRKIKKDREKARELYEKVANKGYIPAIMNLAFMYSLGEGIVVNKKKAFGWFLKAAIKGNAQAQFNIGNAYYLGKVTKKNINKALFWYKKSASQGYKNAIRNVSWLEGKMKNNSIR